MLPRFPQQFLYVLNETLSLLGSLYISTIISWFVGPSFENFQNPRILFPLPVKEKNTMKHTVYETTKVNIPNLLRD